MRTDFSINARQIKEIFPESWLKPNGNIVFRGIAKEDVDELFAMDPYCSKELYLGCVDGKYVYIIAAFHRERMIGHISTASEKTLSLVRVFVREDCRKKNGLGTALLLVFFCFAA